MWLWCRPVAIALIGPIAWKPPSNMSVVLKQRETNKKKKRESCAVEELPYTHIIQLDQLSLTRQEREVTMATLCQNISIKGRKIIISHVPAMTHDQARYFTNNI